MTESADASTVRELPDFDELWDHSQPEATEERFRNLLDKYADAPLSWRLQLETQIARALNMQRKFGEAHKTLLGVVKALDDTPVAAIRHLLERGRIHDNAGAPDEAERLWKRAFEMATDHDHDRLAVDGAYLMSTITHGEGALEWKVEMLEIALSSEDERAIRTAWQKLADDTSVEQNESQRLARLGELAGE